MEMLFVHSLGIGQSYGYRDPDQIKLEILIDKNKKKYLAKKISIEKFLEISLSRFNSFLDIMVRNYNFNKDNTFTSKIFKVNDYSYKHVLEAAHYKKHHIFLDAFHEEMFLRYFSDIFDFEIKFINEESKDTFYGATFVYLYSFKKSIKDKDPKHISEIHRHNTTKKFLDLVLKKIRN